MAMTAAERGYTSISANEPRRGCTSIPYPLGLWAISLRV